MEAIIARMSVASLATVGDAAAAHPVAAAAGGRAVHDEDALFTEAGDVRQQTLLALEFRANGTVSQMGHVTPRQLYKYPCVRAPSPQF
jgi:hypothetical protein